MGDFVICIDDTGVTVLTMVKDMVLLTVVRTGTKLLTIVADPPYM